MWRKRNCEFRKTNRALKLTVVMSFVCVAMLTLGTISVRAAEVDSYYPEFKLSDAENMSNEVQMTQNADFSYEEIQKEEVFETGTSTYAENTPPVAGLAYAILNPDSLINGQITTNTQIAWLWSYNGVNYTYDPDGDSIVDMRIGGISNNDIIGMMEGNIGFATQFTTAGQYQLTFQVQDSQGAWSNIAKYVVNVEPTGGNTRPVCNIVYTPQYLIPQQMMMLSWAQSSDADTGDSVVGLGGMVVKDGVITALGDYVKQLNATDCILSFDETGSYEIWVRVSDSHNAWSNWAIFTIEVEAAQISNVQINDTDYSNTETAWWVDDSLAKVICKAENISADWAGANYLLKQCGSHSFPSNFPSKLIYSDFGVSGTLLTTSGKPVANVSVTIKMPLTKGRGINQSVMTDANGNFSYHPSEAQYWVDTGYYSNANQIDWLNLGDITTAHTRFSSSTGTDYITNTAITISAGTKSYSEDVTCVVGYTKLAKLGWLFYSNGSWYYL